MIRAPRYVVPLVFVAFLSLGFGASSCAHNPAPDVTVLQYGSTVLASATALQKGITALTDSKVLPVPLAQKLTSYVDLVYAASGPLGEAVQQYHSLTDLNLKKLMAAKIAQLITNINGPIGKLLAEVVPAGAVNQIAQLAGNVMAAVAQVQLLIAQNLK